MLREQTQETRRRFLATIAPAGIVAIVGSGFAAGSVTASELLASAGQDEQPRGAMPHPPLPADPSEQDKNAAPGLDPQTAKRAQLQRDEKEFREGVERLYTLATELRDEVAQTPTKAVLSVRMYKKTEEIEKLAKTLKSLSLIHI